MRIGCVYLVLGALGCLEPSSATQVICHNANCAAGARLDADDTLDALRASLALRARDGRVVFDGMELDSTWDRERARCTFTHAPAASAPDLDEAAALVVAHVAAAMPDAAAHGAVFYLKIELKTDVGGGAAHTPAEAGAHVACVASAARAVIAAGAASQNTVIPIFDSDDPHLLAAIDPRPFAELGAGCLFETDWSAPAVAGFAPQILTVAWFEASQAVTRDARTARRGATGADRGGLAIWARSPAPQDLYAMLAHQPAYIVVNNAEDARSLLPPATP